MDHTLRSYELRGNYWVIAASWDGESQLKNLMYPNDSFGKNPTLEASQQVALMFDNLVILGYFREEDVT